MNAGRICATYDGTKTGKLSVSLSYNAMNTADKPDILADVEKKLDEIEEIIEKGITGPTNTTVETYFAEQ